MKEGCIHSKDYIDGSKTWHICQRWTGLKKQLECKGAPSQKAKCSEWGLVVLAEELEKKRRYGSKVNTHVPKEEN